MRNDSDAHSPGDELKILGLKATGPRMKILEIFQRAEAKGERHLCAEDVYRILLQENNDIGLATVYRVLTQFVNAGILMSHHFGNDRASYEIDDGAHHDHIVCTRCGRVEEFVDKDIESRQNQIAARMGFAIESHTLSLYGVCSDCLRRQREKERRKDG